MKTLPYFMITIMSLLILIGCDKENEKEPKEPKVVTETAATCFEITDRPVPQGLVEQWVTNWALNYAEKMENPGNTGGNFPAMYGRKLSDFEAIIADYDQFRIYYAFCAGPEGTYPAYLLMQALDSECEPVINDCVFKFAPIGFGDGFSECTTTGCTDNDASIPYNTAIQWTTNYRDHLGVSLTDSIVSPFGDKTFMIPLAFNYDKESFLQNIEPGADSIYVNLGLEPGGGVGANPDYRFKLLFGTISGPGDGQNGQYIDFAGPCPYNCGNGNDQLLGE